MAPGSTLRMGQPYERSITLWKTPHIPHQALNNMCRKAPTGNELTLKRQPPDSAFAPSYDVAPVNRFPRANPVDPPASSRTRHEASLMMFWEHKEQGPPPSSADSPAPGLLS
jgi:hypothetical protein